MSYRDVRKDFQNTDSICVIAVIVKKKVKIRNTTITTNSTKILCWNGDNLEKYTSNCIIIWIILNCK